MGELDFRDMYWQLPFKSNSSKDLLKMAYLCIRTPFGTMTYARGAMGLLGMDSIQEELTDRLIGDLVHEGKAFKIADNIYFGGKNMIELISIFGEILRRCDLASLRIKPSKVKLKITSADILGLHWSKGYLSPSPHKVDPLTVCQKPSTVKGLRSFLGAVRWHEICLPGGELAQATTLLDEQTISSRKGSDEIQWTESLSEGFYKIQDILKRSNNVAIPRPGDVCYIANDASQSLPAMATKLFLKRPGIDHFLPSFNFGFRIKTSMKDYSPCELEAFSLNKGIQKLSHFLKSTGNDAIALVDSKATFQAKKRLDEGKFSTSPRLQDLLSNLSAHRISLQHISAKRPDPTLRMIDYNSRNPVECKLDTCTICEGLLNPDQTFVGLNIAIPSEALPYSSRAVWRNIQHTCPDLRRTSALLQAGKVPHRKEKKSKDVRTYTTFELGATGLSKSKVRS